MKLLLLAVSMLLTTLSCVTAEDAALQALKSHFANLATGNSKGLQKSYAKKLILMPGHEFLAPEHGIVVEADRAGPATIETQKLLDLIEKKTEGRARPPEDAVKEMIETLTFEKLKTKEGDFATDPPKNLKIPDGQLHFTIVEGDVLYKALMPDGSFSLTQLRSVDGKWQVVAECFR